MSQKKIIKKPVSIVILSAIVLFPLLNNYKILFNCNKITAIAMYDRTVHLGSSKGSYTCTVYEYLVDDNTYEISGASNIHENKGELAEVLYQNDNPKNGMLLKASALYLNPKILLLIFAFVIYYGFEKALEYNRTYSKNRKIIR